MAGELERRWNESLEAIQQIEGEIAAIEAAKPSSLTLKAHEFIRRFLLHVLPDGLQRIRHYGFLANGHRRAGWH